MEIKLLITDFDGTLVNTFQANYHAYREAFGQCGLTLTQEQYRGCYGLRFDAFMDKMGIDDLETRKKIRGIKGDCYPSYFGLLQANQPLLDFIRMFRQSGGRAAVASTARAKNLANVLNHIGAQDDFDLILAGHAHAGQFRVPFVNRGLIAPNQGFLAKYVNGTYELSNGSIMEVSRGLARESTPLPRYFNHPEIVVIDLKYREE